MALPQLIEKQQRDWLFKVTRQNSKQPERDQCLLAFFFGSACTTLEINRIQLKDVLNKSGRLNRSYTVRGVEREFYLSNPRLCEYLNQYLAYRVKNRIGLGDNPDQYLLIMHCFIHTKTNHSLSSENKHQRVAIAIRVMR